MMMVLLSPASRRISSARSKPSHSGMWASVAPVGKARRARGPRARRSIASRAGHADRFHRPTPQDLVENLAVGGVVVDDQHRHAVNGRQALGRDLSPAAPRPLPAWR